MDELGEEHYKTKTRGEREVGAARAAGEGMYKILRHGDHTHLVYSLELPHKEGEVQEAFNIEDKASYIISIKNPAKGGPGGIGSRQAKEVDYPKWLKKVFEGKRFADAEPADFLNYEGTQFILIAASGDASEELGIKLDKEKEDASSADVFEQLGLERGKRPLEPLTKGEWK